MIDDREDYKVVEGYYDIDELYSEVIEEYPKLRNLNLNGISWSKKIYKSWFGICYKFPDDSHSIFINPLLSSPNISREAVKYIIYHELLHAYGLWDHDEEFRDEEWKYPNSANLDGELDELGLNFGIDFKSLKGFRLENITLGMPGASIKGPEAIEEGKQEDDKNREEKIKYKFCRNCGNKLPVESRFCDKCGSNVEYN